MALGSYEKSVKMGNRTITNHRINMISLLVAVVVFGSGLILFFLFHVGHGAHRTELFGVTKTFWLDIHLVSSLAFLVATIVHIHAHWRYIASVSRRWRVNLPKKIKSTTYEQALLLITAAVVLWAAFYAWIAFPNATLENRDYHRWIDIHNRVGILLLTGIGVHIKRRWKRVFSNGSVCHKTSEAGK
jgi:hypothetical protein